MASTKRFAVNVGMNWAATAVGMVIPFFLTPFVVRHLGTTAYGVWILAVSAVSYLALLDLGLRSAIIRFVSKAQAQNNPAEATRAIGTALWFRLLVASGVAVLAVGLALLTPHLFKIPPEMRHAARITVLCCALGVGVTLVSGVFGAVLAAINRFDVLSSILMAQTVARALGVLLLLSSGRGLIALALWELLVITLAGALTALAALRVFPHCRVLAVRPDRAVFHAIWSYSLTTFVFMIAVQVVINTDALVIGAFLSVGLVTFYSIGASLVSYSAQVTGALSTTFTPMASGFEASGRTDDLRKLLLRGTQATLGLVFPIAIALIFRGETFITLWMGPQYGHVSETVLRILMISLFFAVGDGTAGAVMMAIDKHKPVARWAVYEAVLNLALSILLVKTVGLYGVAWGTSLSMTFTHLAFYPRYVEKVLHIPARTYIWEGWGKITLCSLPFAAVCALADHFWRAPNLVLFLAQIVVTLPVYLVCVLALFHTEARSALHKWQSSRRLAQV